MRKERPSTEEIALILSEFDGVLSITKVCKKYGRDFNTVRSLWLTQHSERELDQRKRRVYAESKRGAKNPMFGKQGAEHHNAKMYTTSTQGYVKAWAPEWFTGKTDGGRALLHVLVYCEENGMTEVPAGFVVHHIDCDRTNNAPGNLVMLTIADHRRIHAFIRNVQRLSPEGE